MAYWFIQILLFLTYIAIGYASSESYREIYGDTETLIVYFFSALCFILSTHCFLRPLTKYWRKKDKSIFTILLLAAPIILVCTLLTSTVQNLSKDRLFLKQKEQAYYLEKPDQLPQNQLAQVNNKLALIKADKADELSEVQSYLEKYQQLSKDDQKRKSQAYVHGLTIGLEEKRLNLEAKLNSTKAGNSNNSKLLNGLILFLYMLWYLPYLLLSAAKKRIQIKNQLKQSQIALLMSQLNPHFLFNSLNSIRGMIFEDKQLAKELIDKLNELFEYNLTANKHATVKLKEELRICEFYLDIEHIRLEERLSIEMSIDESCLNYKVPTMGLLTLIENAIKHGIAPRPEPSTLVVNIKRQQEDLIIDVSNPVYKGNYQVQSTGTGQENLLKRLQLMYSKRASLNTALDNESYLATLRLPI
jgi:ABC-type transport system involved in multi-copper enzyme maturation permease subunit